MNLNYTIPSLKKYQCSSHLDILRGIAALEVFLCHFRNLFFIDYEEINQQNILIKIFYLFTGFGHQAVIIFFILSGFFISSSILRTRQDNQWSWSLYLINRLSRLQLVLIPGLLLCYFWDSLGINIFGENSIYGGITLGSNVVNYKVSERLNLLTFIGNLFFTQNILVSTFGSNSPLWSLSNEFWYYILFPLCLLILSSKVLFKKRFFYLLITIFLFWFIGISTTLYFSVWLMGTLISFCPLPKIIKSRKVFSLFVSTFLLIFITFLMIVKLNVIQSNFMSDLLVGIASTILIYVILHDRTEIQKGIYTSVSQTLASFSYTLYLVHLPILVFLKACLLHSSRWQPNIYYFSLGLLICVIVLMYAFFISLLTEVRTDKLRQIVMLRLRNYNK